MGKSKKKTVKGEKIEARTEKDWRVFEEVHYLTEWLAWEFALELEAAEPEGQLMPCLPLVRPSEGVAQALPIVTFPGNLGTDSSLFEAWQRMQAG